MSTEDLIIEIRKEISYTNAVIEDVHTKRSEEPVLRMALSNLYLALSNLIKYK